MVVWVVMRATFDKRIFGVVMVGLGGLLASSAEDAASEPGPNVVGDTPMTICDLPPKMPYDSTYSFGETLDWAHDRVFITVQRRVEWFDKKFHCGEFDCAEVPVARFRFASLLEYADRDTADFGNDTEFDMDAELPNAERRLRLFVTTRELDELPGGEEFEEDRSIRVGLSKRLREWFDLDAGIKAKWEPEVFTRIRWKRHWELGHWSIYPGISGFWENDEGLGLTGDLTGDRWVGRGFGRTSTGFRWSEGTTGVEWTQNILVGYAHELLEENRLGKRASGRDVARGGGARFTMHGHESGSFEIDSYKGSLFYRFPLRKRWLYAVIEPEITFRDERDWEAEPGIRLGFDMLFWGLEHYGK